MSKRGFEIHIDRIALTAMPPGGERRLREAVADELARLDGKAADIARGHPRHAGERVATSIAGQLEARLTRVVTSQ